jgi:hypothetical protein
MWSSWRGSEKKPEIDAENEWDIIEKKPLPMHTGGGVKVLSKKTWSKKRGLMIILKFLRGS